eukprot:gnl/TRDRNA2_/TRDRNA2_199497_c0_seq1.p1 gnl/TRDRNA2_/TRDRNA2_199497_c0~~gnl/TRDRNA2_/TRDRNA2_199497_c0_seq1.p1  ORF type:complete len:119 (+),score=10.88 gnl/TRDRNA2_/TRDRNA2_199497_c0_seq1:75-431(+)
MPQIHAWAHDDYPGSSCIHQTVIEAAVVLAFANIFCRFHLSLCTSAASIRIASTTRVLMTRSSKLKLNGPLVFLIGEHCKAWGILVEGTSSSPSIPQDFMSEPPVGSRGGCTSDLPGG